MPTNNHPEPEKSTYRKLTEKQLRNTCVDLCDGREDELPQLLEHILRRLNVPEMMAAYQQTVRETEHRTHMFFLSPDAEGLSEKKLITVKNFLTRYLNDMRYHEPAFVGCCVGLILYAVVEGMRTEVRKAREAMRGKDEAKKATEAKDQVQSIA